MAKINMDKEMCHDFFFSFVLPVLATFWLITSCDQRVFSLFSFYKSTLTVPEENDMWCELEDYWPSFNFILFTSLGSLLVGHKVTIRGSFETICVSKFLEVKEFLAQKTTILVACWG